MTLKNDEMSAVKIIFDNSGGTTMQLGKFKHVYNNCKHAAVDYCQYLQENNTDGWDGHEEDIDMCVEPEAIRNGGCVVCREDDIADLLDNYTTEPDPGNWQGWGWNQTGFITALAAIMTKQKETAPWKVSEEYENWCGSYLEFRRGDGDYELSPAPYFYDEALTKEKLRLYPVDIGHREACRELCRRYGDTWNVEINRVGPTDGAKREE